MPPQSGPPRKSFYAHTHAHAQTHTHTKSNVQACFPDALLKVARKRKADLNDEVR